MGVSNRLRLRDAENVFDLVQECRDLWADAMAWQRHLLQGACRLTGMAVGSYIEQVLRSADVRSADLRSAAAPSGEQRVEFLDMADCGWRDPAARARFMSMFTDHADLSVVCPGVKRLAASAQARGNVIAVRPQLIPDRSWYASRIFNEYRRPAYVDGYILSYALGARTGSQIRLAVSQDVGDRPPTPRATAILALLNRRIAPLVGTVLSTRRQPGVHDLPPRLRQTLDLLLSGRSEKQIAADLGIAPTTVHDHVARLYRHFKVENRGELMSCFVRRTVASRGDC